MRNMCSVTLTTDAFALHLAFWEILSCQIYSFFLISMTCVNPPISHKRLVVFQRIAFSKASSDQLIMVILMRSTACAPREKKKIKYKDKYWIFQYGAVINSNHVSWNTLSPVVQDMQVKMLVFQCCVLFPSPG